MYEEKWLQLQLHLNAKIGEQSSKKWKRLQCKSRDQALIFMERDYFNLFSIFHDGHALQGYSVVVMSCMDDWNWGIKHLSSNLELPTFGNYIKFTIAVQCT